MATGALEMAWKTGKDPFLIKLVTVGAVGPKARLGIQPPPWIDMGGVCKVEEDGSLPLVQRVGQKIFIAGGRKGGVALAANRGIDLRFKGFLMAQLAGVVAGPGQLHGALLDGEVADAAVKFQQAGMELVDKERLFRLLL